MTTKHLYFIGILPPPGLSARITAVKQHFTNQYNSSKALKVMPHITVKAPFTIDETEVEKMTKWFNELSIQHPPFQIQLEGFGAFDRKPNPVIYIKPLESPLLNDIQKTLLESFRICFPEQIIMHPEWHYHPHITVAYRDLTYENFEAAWREVQQQPFEGAFEVEALYLFMHNRRQWNLFDSLPLVSMPENNIQEK